MPARLSNVRRLFSQSSKSTAASRCLEFVCFVKPPFDLQTLVQLGQGNDFLPLISVRASRNSLSTSSVSVSTISSDRFRLKSVKLSPCDSLSVWKSTHVRLLHVQEFPRENPERRQYQCLSRPPSCQFFLAFVKIKRKCFPVSNMYHISRQCVLSTLSLLDTAIFDTAY